MAPDALVVWSRGHQHNVDESGRPDGGGNSISSRGESLFAVSSLISEEAILDLLFGRTGNQHPADLGQ